VRQEGRVTIYLDSNGEPEISGEVAAEAVKKPTALLIGGGSMALPASKEGSTRSLFMTGSHAGEFAVHHRAAKAP